MVECMRSIAKKPEFGKWIPINERLPNPEEYVLISFENFTLPDIGRYEADEDGNGAFYPVDDEKSYTEYNVFANAWMPLPQPYKGEEAIKGMGEIQKYRSLEKRISNIYGGSISLETIVDEMERRLKEPGNPHPMNAKILTYEDAADWDAYRAIGTPEECKEAMDFCNTCPSPEVRKEKKWR